MSILEKIVENTRDNLKVKKTNLSLEEIKSSLAELSLPKSNFKSSIVNKNEAIIAEIKKASPSAGVIAEDFNPARAFFNVLVFPYLFPEFFGHQASIFPCFIGSIQKSASGRESQGDNFN